MTNQEIQRLLDEAVATLKQTTVGWANHSSAWQQNQSTKWWQGLNKIRQAHLGLGDEPDPPPPPDPPGPQPASSYLNNLGDFGRPAKAWDNATNWHPDSARLVKYLTDNMAQSGSVPLALQSYGVVVVHAKSSDPQVTVTDSRGWGTLPKGTHGPLRCPSYANGASGTDGHLSIVQPDGSCWDMWRGRRQSSSSFTSEATCLAKPGQWNFPQASCRGSSFTLLSGAIAPEEIQAGINHALLAVMDAAIIKEGPVPPSNGSDGTLAYGIPEGARLVLDPSLAPPGGASPLTKSVFRALQRYGMYLGDRTGSPQLSFIAIDPVTFTAAGKPDPWKAQGLTGYPIMNELIPLLRYLRVERW